MFNILVFLFIYLLFLVSFSHERRLMVFHLRQSDTKSLQVSQVSRTLLCILAVLNNAVGSMFHRFPTLRAPLWWSCQPHQLQLVSPSPWCSIVFLVLKQGLSIHLSFRFLFIFTLSAAETANAPIRQGFFFFVCWQSLGLVVWSRLGDLFVSQNQENFMRPILQDGFWVVHIRLVRMVKVKLLAQFPVDPLAHPVVSSLILFLRLFCD